MSEKTGKMADSRGSQVGASNGASIQIGVFDDPALAAADRLITAAGAGGHIALTGGTTARAVYEHAATVDSDWSSATAWFGDERCVSPDDALSNFGLARNTLVDRLGRPPRVCRIRGELDSEVAARDYERVLIETFAGDVPRFDLILLGIGSDAHCASLFPGHSALTEKHRLAVAVEMSPLEPQVPRVTLTLPVLNAAAEVVFLARGQAKAEAVARAFEGHPDPDAPASLVRPVDGRLFLFADEAAASMLSARA